MNRKFFPTALVAGVLSCLLSTQVAAAEITPSNEAITLASSGTTITFQLSISEAQAFAGAEFTLKPSNSDVTFVSCEFLSDTSGYSTIQGEKNGAVTFGFFTGVNAFSGDYDVAELTYSYSGSEGCTIDLTASTITTVEENGDVSTDTSSDAFSVAISRTTSSGSSGSSGSSSSSTTTDDTTEDSVEDTAEDTTEDTSTNSVVDTFSDVSAGDWYADSVSYVVEQGLFNGISDSQFAPSSNMTRAMIMTVLHRASGDETFTDGSLWYDDGMNWAMAFGISDGTDPDGNVTREQLATMLYRYAGAPAVEVDMSGYSDLDSVSDWTAEAMAWAVECGIINGKTATTLAPQDLATRAEVATMVVRFLLL